MRVGSLCTGYGGLDLAVGGDLAWVSEIDPDASRVLAERFDAPNIGDFTTTTPPPVDMITAGFPCQPVSVAGQRKGTEDDRWLWDDIATLIRNMEPRPGYVFLENVAGLLTANSGHAMARVMHDLAVLGFDAEWGTLRAADIGAPHRRNRWFCLATHPDSELSHRGRPPRPRRRLEPATRSDTTPNPDSEGSQRHRQPVERPRKQSAATSRPQPVTPNPNSAGLSRVTELDSEPETHSEETKHWGHADRLDDQTRWGNYSQAISRWAATLGRPAPHPTTDGRLNPRFVEWMMGLPAGHVTDLNLSRAAQLRILGNGVVPQQAAHATHLLATRTLEAAA